MMKFILRKYLVQVSDRSPCRSVLLEKVTVDPHFTKPEGSLPFSPKSVIEPYAEKLQSSYTFSLRHILILSSHLLLILPIRFSL